MKKKQIAQGVAVVGAGIALLNSIKNRAKSSQNATTNTANARTAYDIWLESNKSSTQTEYLSVIENGYLTLDVKPSGGDNTAQILYHINKAANERKALFVKKYESPYLVSNAIPVSCTIFSDGATITQTGVDKCLFTVTNQQNLSVWGLTLDVNARTQSEDLAYGNHVGVKVLGSKRINLSRLELKKYWGAAISLNNSFDCVVDDVLCIDSVATTDLWEGETEHGDADIQINSEISGGRNIVKNCKCFSHKSSIGIWVNGLGNDTMNTLEHNFCAALMPDFTRATPENIKKRHGIQLGYNTSVNKTYNRAVFNYCFNTGITGISIASRGFFQTIDVSHNYCEKNGTGGVDGAILRGGIQFQHFGFGSTCTNNVIVDFQTDSLESGALSFVRSATVEEEGTLFCDNNTILNSASHGVYIGYRSSNIHLRNTTVKGSAKADLWYFDMTANAHDVKIENLFTERTNSAFPSIRIQNAYSMKGFSIRGGKLQGMSDTVNEDNVGIWLLQGAIAGMHPIKIEDLDVDGFGIGIGLYNPITADIRNNVIIRDIRFTNMPNGLAARQGDANGILPCFECSFTNVTNKTSGWGYASAARIATPTYNLTT